MKLKRKPTTFKNQREAYWFKKGYEEAQKQINDLMNSKKKMYSLEFLDHLPTGNDKKEIKNEAY